PLAAAGQGLAEELLALGPAVGVGGVEEVDPGVKRRVDHPRRGLGVQAPAEVVAAETDERDFKRADAPSFHTFPLPHGSYHHESQGAPESLQKRIAPWERWRPAGSFSRSRPAGRQRSQGRSCQSATAVPVLSLPEAVTSSTLSSLADHKLA